MTKEPTMSGEACGISRRVVEPSRRRGGHLATLARAGVVSSGALLASNATADFDSFSWTLSQRGLAGAEQFAAGADYELLAPAAVGGSGTVNSSTMTVAGGNAAIRGVTFFTATAAVSGVVRIDWSFVNSPGNDVGGWDAGGVVVGGTFTALAINAQSPASGTESFAVLAGEAFGFGTATADGLFGASTTTFTNLQFTPNAPATCPADLDGNGRIDGADLGILLSAWGSTGHPADLDGDGSVNGADLAALLAEWGATCPSAPWATILEQTPHPNVVTNPALRSAIIATGLPWRVRDNASQIEMLLVPPGTFTMGCSPSLWWGCQSEENPIHQVTLTRPFYLGRYEVTQTQWTAVMGKNPSWFQSPSAEVSADQVPNRPVEMVSWNMIQSFNAATGLRLPTEAEIEYACRAGTTTAFNNGSDNDATLGTLAWFGPNAAGQTRPVGQKLPNALGFHDMHGNVWEWVNDWFSATYYSVSPGFDPPGPASGTLRVLRGGSMEVASDSCRASFRPAIDPSAVGWGIGFRAARTP